MITIYSTANRSVLMMVDNELGRAFHLPELTIEGSVNRVSDGAPLLRFRFIWEENGPVRDLDIIFHATEAWSEYSDEDPITTPHPQSTFRDLSWTSIQKEVTYRVGASILKSGVVSTEHCFNKLAPQSNVVCRNTDVAYMTVDSIFISDAADEDESRAFMDAARDYCIRSSRMAHNARRAQMNRNPLPPMFSDWNMSRMIYTDVHAYSSDSPVGLFISWAIEIVPTDDGIEYCVRDAWTNRKVKLGGAAICGHLHKGATFEDLLLDLESKYDSPMLGISIFEIKSHSRSRSSGGSIIPDDVSSSY